MFRDFSKIQDLKGNFYVHSKLCQLKKIVSIRLDKLTDIPFESAILTIRV